MNQLEVEDLIIDRNSKALVYLASDPDMAIAIAKKYAKLKIPLLYNRFENDNLEYFICHEAMIITLQAWNCKCNCCVGDNCEECCSDYRDCDEKKEMYKKVDNLGFPGTFESEYKFVFTDHNLDYGKMILENPNKILKFLDMFGDGRNATPYENELQHIINNIDSRSIITNSFLYLVGGHALKFSHSVISSFYNFNHDNGYFKYDKNHNYKNLMNMIENLRYVEYSHKQLIFLESMSYHLSRMYNMNLYNYIHFNLIHQYDESILNLARIRHRSVYPTTKIPGNETVMRILLKPVSSIMKFSMKNPDVKLYAVEF